MQLWRRARNEGGRVVTRVNGAHIELPEHALEQITRALGGIGGNGLRLACRHGRQLANGAVTAAKVGLMLVFVHPCFRKSRACVLPMLTRSNCAAQIVEDFKQALKALPAAFPNLQGLQLG